MFSVLFFHEDILPDDIKKTGGDIAIFNLKAPDDNRHYGIIIPESISRSIPESYGASAERIKSESDISETPSEKQIEKILSNISDKELSRFTFIITGESSIIKTPEMPDRLKIQLQITDLRNLNSESVVIESEETGAVLKASIDELTSEIVEKLNLLNSAYTTEPEQSSFASIYSNLKGFYFGMDSGFMYLHGSDWKNFDDPVYVGTYVSYRINRYTASLNYSYTSSLYQDTLGDETTMAIHSFTFSSAFSLFYTDYFSLDVFAGGGGARVKIMDITEIFAYPAASYKSWNPVLEAGISFSVSLDSLLLRTGARYRHITHDKTGGDINSTTIFIGAGYTL